MEGTMIQINSSADLTAIDNIILDNLYNGVAIYVLKFSHIVCENSDTVLYNNFINNKEQCRKVLFIGDHMENELKIVENIYFHESRRTTGPLDKFKWLCPFCQKKFKKM